MIHFGPPDLQHPVHSEPRPGPVQHVPSGPYTGVPHHLGVGGGARARHRARAHEEEHRDSNGTRLQGTRAPGG